MSTPMEKEAQFLRDINSVLKQTLDSLDSVSSNLHVLSDNLTNSNKLSNIYTDIHLHNRKLNNTLQIMQSQKPTDNSSINMNDLDTQLKTLEKRKSILKSQLSDLKKM